MKSPLTLERPPGRRRSADRALAAQQAVARVLADAQTIKDVAGAILSALCRCLDWEAGALWELDENTKGLRCVEFWKAPEIRLQGFETVTREMTVPLGAGLPGQIFASREALWLSDLSRSRGYPRAASALRGGLRSAFGFPLKAGRTVFGVIELYSTRFRELDDDLVGMLAVVGGHIGQFIRQKRVEDTLRESEEKYRLLFAAVTEAIIIYDAETLRIVDANAAAVGLYGYTRDELGRMSIEALTAPGPRPSDFLPSVELPARRAPLLYQLRKDGWTFPAEVAVATYRLRRQLRGIYLVRDITERRQAEEAEKLRQSEKLQREFVATVSHELRTPVAAIKGFAETLKLGGLDDARNRLKFVLIIERHAHRLSRLIEDILELSALESGKRVPKPEPILLRTFVRRMVRGLSPLLKAKKLSVRAEIPANVRAHADRSMLGQVFHNLLSNAIKFSPTAGRIRVCVEPMGEELRISVCDSGPGIAPEHLPHIFERFNVLSKQEKRAGREGTGLGLSIVKQILEAHGGRIWAESAKGQGTRFFFQLARAGARAKQ